LHAKTFTKLLTLFLLRKNKYFLGKAFFFKERFVIKGSEVLIMGLAYKENVPDTRESPVREIIKELKEFGIKIYGYDIWH
jgi:UDP-N-acetyl-D-mannosaminuronate dehydrogenase